MLSRRDLYVESNIASRCNYSQIDRPATLLFAAQRCMKFGYCIYLSIDPRGMSRDITNVKVKTLYYRPTMTIIAN